MTTDAEIIEAMESEWRKVYPNAPAHTLEDGMRALIAICAPAIRAQAMEEAAKGLREIDRWATAFMDAVENWEERAVQGGLAQQLRIAIDEALALAPPAVAEKGESEVAVFANATSNDEEPVTISRAMLYSSIMGAARLLTHQHDTALRITREAFASIDALSAPAAPAQSKGET